MRFFQTSRLLDVATGTADLAIDAASKYPAIQVTGVDFVREMIELGHVKVEKRGLSDRIRLFRGDALALPFREGSFDVAAIAFGIRNIPAKIAVLQEMRRVVVPGGQVMVLEMTSPSSPLFKRIYHLYLNRILPRMASAFSRNPGAYYYLADSIKNFPAPQAFAKMMEKAGLARVEMHPLDFGITYLHIAVKPQGKTGNGRIK